MTAHMAKGAFSASTLHAGVSDFRDRVVAGEISVRDTIRGFFEEADRRRNLNIYITEMREQALAQAALSDERIAQGKPRPLEGLPIAVKDNYCTEGVRTTAASKMLENFVPSYDATVVRRLKEAGAIILGKTNMDEFAMGSSTESSFFGPTINPTGELLGIPNLVPGGSSGGSAAAVAANLALAALGTDTGGSIRQPASFCGVVGFKPTYGVCSRWGIVAYGSSLDQAGVFCKQVADVALLMDVIAGYDAKDSTSFPHVNYGFENGLYEKPTKLKIGVVREVIEAGVTEDSELILDKCRRIAGHIDADIVDVSIPSFKFALPAYYIIALSEASSNLARYDGVRFGFRAKNPVDLIDMYGRTRAEGFGAEVKRRIILGTFALSAGYYDAYYLKAQRVRKKIAEEFASAFLGCDFLFMPTTPTAAFSIGSRSADPVAMYLEDIYTVPINLAGLPAINIPVAKNGTGLPLGLQIVGKPFSDVSLVRAAISVELANATLRS